MRRDDPPVKQRGEQFCSLVCGHTWVCHHSGFQKSGASCDTPVPPFPCSRRNTSHSMAAALRGEQRANPAAASRFACCTALRSATRIFRSLPGGVVGAGNGVELSDEGLQLVFLQLGPEFPFQPVGHLLPGSSRGFHLLEHGEGVCQGAVVVISLVVGVPSS
jgi:hypothetical protein